MMTNIIKTLVKVGTFDCFVFWTMPPESIIFFRSLKFTSPFPNHDIRFFRLNHGFAQQFLLVRCKI